MQRRIRFATTNTLYSPPNSPSPSLSHSSLHSDDSSAPELTTPPPEIDYSPHYPQSPYPHSTDFILHPQHQIIQQQHQSHNHNQHYEALDVVAKNPPSPEQPMQIHYLLAYNPLAELPIHFDLSLHWSQILEQVQPHELGEPATNPPLSSIIIITPLIPWQFLITASTQSGHITVQDLLTTLFRELRLAVRRDEYNATDVVTRSAVDAAYHARYSRVQDSQTRENERCKGVKKVDFLQGRNLFKGLSGTMAGPGVWELNVA